MTVALCAGATLAEPDVAGALLDVAADVAGSVVAGAAADGARRSTGRPPSPERDDRLHDRSSDLHDRSGDGLYDRRGRLHDRSSQPASTGAATACTTGAAT